MSMRALRGLRFNFSQDVLFACTRGPGETGPRVWMERALWGRVMRYVAGVLRGILHVSARVLWLRARARCERRPRSVLWDEHGMCMGCA